jgi:hypothetical protein
MTISDDVHDDGDDGDDDDANNFIQTKKFHPNPIFRYLKLRTLNKGSSLMRVRNLMKLLDFSRRE